MCWRAGIDPTELDVKPPPNEGFERINDKGDFVISDVFKLCKHMTKTGKKKIKYLCVIPEQRVFYEVILAFYTVFFPEIFPDSKSIADKILSTFDRFKYSPEGVKNMEVQHYKYLLQLQKEEKYLQYLTHPVEVAIALFAVLWSSSANGETEEVRNKRLDELSIEREESYFANLHWEEEWKKLVRVANDIEHEREMIKDWYHETNQ